MFNSLYGNYRQVKFTDVYPDAETFVTDYNESALPTTISNDTATTLYYLLYSRYGNSVIASSDTNRFKYDLFATIFSYAPTWEKRLDVQEKLRKMSDAELFTGQTTINNHSFNPSTAPSTSTLDELTTINEQHTLKGKRDKLTAYTELSKALWTDVTEQFLDKFQKLFLIILQPELPLWYATPVIEDNIIGDGEGDGN